MGKVSIVVMHYPTLVGKGSYALSYFGGKEQAVCGKVL